MTTDRCGHTLATEELPGDIGGVCCWREPANDADRCVWHAHSTAASQADIDAALDIYDERLDGARLSGVTLSNVSFAGVSLAHADFTGATLEGVIFRDARLPYADFTDATCRDVSFKSADLRMATLADAALAGSCSGTVTFADAALDRADLSGANLWQATLAGATCADVDLSRARLREADLSEADLRGATLAYARLRLADLRNTELSEATLERADLRGATLAGATLRSAVLRAANCNPLRAPADIVGDRQGPDSGSEEPSPTHGDIASERIWSTFVTNTTNAVLEGVDQSPSELLDVAGDEQTHYKTDLTSASLLGADLTGATLREANLAGAELQLVSGTRADFTDATATNAVFDEADLSKTVLRGANFAGANFREAKLRESVCEGCSFEGIDFSGSDLAGSDLTNATLEAGSLEGARVDDGTLVRSDLSGVTATEASFVGANLRGAVLSDGDFTDAALSECILEGAEIIGVRLRGAALDRAKLFDAVLDDIRISEDTDFGTLTGYEGPTDTDTDHEKAVRVHRVYQRILRDNSMPEKVPRHYVREKHARRRQHFADNNYLRWFSLSFARWVALYGESPWRVLYTSLVTVLVFGVLYPISGGIQAPDAQPTHVFLNPLPIVRLPSVVVTLLESSYFSLVTFTALGYGTAASAASRTLAGLESTIGAILIALLVAVLSRRLMR